MGFGLGGFVTRGFARMASFSANTRTVSSPLGKGNVAIPGLRIIIDYYYRSINSVSYYHH